MLTLSQAQQLLDSTVQQAAPAKVEVRYAVGCKLSEDLSAPFDSPPFDNSAMDGIALDEASLIGNPPWSLPLSETIEAGHTTDFRLPNGYAVKIMTGAPLPEGANSVIKVEELEFHEGNVIISTRPIPGNHIRPRGGDFRKGDILLQAGLTVKLVDVGVLASIGKRKISVVPKPSVAILSTGSEIVDAGSDLRPGQIYNINEPALLALLESTNQIQATALPSVKDDIAQMTDILSSAITTHRVVITSGSVSMGDFDFIPHVITELGGKIIFHKAKVKPGKPVIFAEFGDTDKRYLIGLPGNPVSVVVGYHLWVKRLIARLMGQSRNPETNFAKLSNDVKIKGARLNIIGVTIENKGDEVHAHPATRQISGHIGSISGIDGFMYVDPEEPMPVAGDMVKVEMM